MEKCDVQKLL